MSQAVQPPEKYQLKWHSHQSNLNSSISSLYKNDKYADVMLLTSNGEDTCGIPAHKLVLGTSSHYFSSIFDSNPAPANTVIYIVLPPELTKRSIQTLIQYMYCGESTVSNDILNEVLRGGEILKIRGLWRNHSNETETHFSSKEPVHHRVRLDRNSIEKQHIQQYAEQRIVVAQESPVIVKTPHSIIPNQTPTINVKKDIAIDPGDQNRPPMQSHNFDHISQPITVAAKKVHQSPSQGKHQHHEMRKENIAVKHYTTTKTLSHRELRPQHLAENHKRIENEIPPEALNFLKVKDEPVEWNDFAHEVEIEKTEMDIPVKPESVYPEDDSDEEQGTVDEPNYSPLTCELCSETFTMPADWVRHIESHAEGHSETPPNIPKKRKRMGDEDDDVTAALKCDLCSTYFVTPAEWVRHVQRTHTETELAISNNSTIPKSFRNVKATSESIPLEKTCSVCNKSFPSYASMIIHRRTHTGERPFYCDICNKGFNVKSNLLRHMRTLHNQQGSHSINDQQDSTTSD